VRRYLWEKVEAWLSRRQDGPMTRALAAYDFAADADTGLRRMADGEMEAMILHEVGEAMAGELLGEAWGEVAASVARSPGETVLRAVRDLLADCLSTLPTLLARADLPALHFHFATFDAPRSELFPEALSAYEAFSRNGDLQRLRHVVQEGRERWLAAARGLLGVAPADREGALLALRAN